MHFLWIGLWTIPVAQPYVVVQRADIPHPKSPKRLCKAPCKRSRDLGILGVRQPPPRPLASRKEQAMPENECPETPGQEVAPITKDQVVERLLDYERTRYDEVNPRATDGSGSCLYTSSENPDWHCIVGQVLTDLDFTAPGPDLVEPASVLLTSEGWAHVADEDAVRLLVVAQGYADKRNRTWGQVVDSLQRTGEFE